MDCRDSETVAAPTDVHEIEGSNSISPTTSPPSPRLEIESVSTAQVPCSQTCDTEIYEPEANQATPQTDLQPEESASSSESGPHKTVSDNSLGLSNAGIIIGGIIASFAAIGFLIFLWTGEGPTSDGQHASHAWRSLMLSGRVPQLVTLSYVLLRFSIGVQTTICTSLVAALILERRSIALSRVASLSVLRSVNSGPRILIQQIVGEEHSRHLLLHPEVFLLFLLALGNIAMQFSSTILFSDLQSRLLAKISQEIQTALLVGINGTVADFILFSQPPHDFSLFVKRHAMISFASSEEIMALRSYRGPSHVLSSRVACMPPTVSAEVRFSNLTISGLPLTQKYGYMTGRIHVNKTFSGAGILDTCDSGSCFSEDIPFDCSMSRSISVLVFRTNFNLAGWESLGDTSVQLPQSEIQEEWRSFDFESDRRINITVCFKSMNIMLSNVSLSTEKNLTEPSIGYSNTIAGITQSLRLFYGAQPDIQKPSEREIFTADEIHDPDNYVYGATDFNQVPLWQRTTSVIESIADSNEKPNTTLAVCFKPFSDIMVTTGRASVAIQILYTMLIQSIHDQIMGYFSVPLPVEVVDTVLATVPSRCVGLGVVAVLVLICIFAITALYLLHSRYTMADNFWHVISQTVSEATAEVLSHSNQTKNKDTSKRFKAMDSQVQLQRLAETGEIKVVKMEKISDIPRILRWYRRAFQRIHKNK
ncbi:hypothetical protein F5Y03DRAFT_407852 [Xylaria venustula]|nr:hypothetical protein F5Y03DRAFT_407852 [Xylaria venustula]